MYWYATHPVPNPYLSIMCSSVSLTNSELDCLLILYLTRNKGAAKSWILYNYFYTGCPRKHDSSKTNYWKSSLNFEYIYVIQSSIFFHIILETITTKFFESWYFQNVVCLFCVVNITGDMKNFVQSSTLSNRTKT